MTTALISHPDCGRHDTSWRHPEHVGRLRAIPRALRGDPELYFKLEQVEARHATEAEISIAHAPEYVRRVRELAESGGGSLDADTIVSGGSWDAALAAAGCIIEGVERAIDGRNPASFCAVRPPGHHALRDQGMGFCIFGNVAIGALHARRLGVERVLIVDWDVHHGNGTQALVEHDPGVRFVSMHQWPWYPGTGAAGDRGQHRNVWNLPMPAGLDPARYVSALEGAVSEAVLGWTPGLVLVSAGFDCLAGDPLGGFTLEPSHLGAFTTRLRERAIEWCDGRVVVALEGGYVPERVGEGAVAVLRGLVD